MVILVLGITVVLSIVCFSNHELMLKLDFQPDQIRRNPAKNVHRFLTHGFVHADWMHLAFNMLTFFFFAPNVLMVFEAKFPEMASVYFLLLYLGGIVISVFHTYEKNKFNVMYRGVGASGGVSSVLFASVIYFPMNSICLYGLLCLPGIIWAVLYVLYSFYMSRSNANDYINHDAHLIGAIYGVVLTLIVDPGAFGRMLQQIFG